MQASPAQLEKAKNDALALIERIVAQGYSASLYNLVDDARAIHAATRIDPDMLAARDFVLQAAGSNAGDDYRRYLAEGAYDDNADVQLYLKAIKHGRTSAQVLF